jgi:hypothetical protein
MKIQTKPRHRQLHANNIPIPEPITFSSVNTIRGYIHTHIYNDEYIAKSDLLGNTITA